MSLLSSIPLSFPHPCSTLISSKGALFTAANPLLPSVAGISLLLPGITSFFLSQLLVVLLFLSLSPFPLISFSFSFPSLLSFLSVGSTFPRGERRFRLKYASSLSWRNAINLTPSRSRFLIEEEPIVKGDESNAAWRSVTDLMKYDLWCVLCYLCTCMSGFV